MYQYDTIDKDMLADRSAEFRRVTVRSAVQRLAQMARAAGLHVILATQRPSVDVITGTIKANFPTRISFQVTSKIDSRTILGEQGAELGIRTGIGRHLRRARGLGCGSDGLRRGHVGLPHRPLRLPHDEGPDRLRPGARPSGRGLPDRRPAGGGGAPLLPLPVPRGPSRSA